MSHRSSPSFAIGGLEWDPETGTFLAPSGGWRCFHCNSHFTSISAARRHFGATPQHMALCLVERISIQINTAARDLKARILARYGCEPLGETAAEEIVALAIRSFVANR